MKQGELSKHQQMTIDSYNETAEKFNNTIVKLKNYDKSYDAAILGFGLPYLS